MLPTHVPLNGHICGLDKDSVVLLEQVRTIDHSRLQEYMGRLDGRTLVNVDQALGMSFGLNPVSVQKEHSIHLRV